MRDSQLARRVLFDLTDRAGIQTLSQYLQGKIIMSWDDRRAD